MWAAAKAIKLQKVPEIMKLGEPTSKEGIRNILVYNHHQGTHHSFILLALPDEKQSLI